MVKKIIILNFVLNIALLSAQNIQDRQFWQAEKINLKINDRANLALEQDFRLENNRRDLYYFHSDFGVSYKLTPTVSFGLNFREIFEHKSTVWVNEHRPHGQIIGKISFHAINITGRTRIEYRILDNERKFRNRDMITIKLAQALTPWKLVPYLADEIFYDLKSNELNRNRAYIGVEIKKIGVVKPVIYYMRQSSLKDNEWINYNVIGLKFSF